MTSAYWASNMTDTVRFHDALVAMLRDGCRAVVEVAPHPVLFSAIRETMTREDIEGVAAYSLRRGAPESATLLANVGALYTAGYPLEWSAIYPGVVDHIGLPAYPWYHRQFWTTAKHRDIAVSTAPRDPVTAAESGPVESAPGSTNTRSPTSSTLWDELVSASRIARKVRLERHVREQITRVLRLDPGEALSRRTLLSDLGMDSVSAIELCAALSLTSGHKVPPTVVFDHPTIEGVTEFLVAELEQLAREPASAPAIEYAVGPAAPSGDSTDLVERLGSDLELGMLEKLAAFEKEYA